MPRLVDALPNGPVGHPTVRVFLAGGVPEVMLQLRELGLLELDVLTVAGCTLGEVLDWLGTIAATPSAARAAAASRDGVDPDDVIMSPAAGPRARSDQHGLLSPRQSGAGRLGDQEHGDRSARGRRRRRVSQAGPARVFIRERDAIAAIKGRGGEPIRPGDVIVLAGRGPLGSGMEETYQITSALRYLDWGREVAVVTDARFSGVSTGACIGHVGPEALGRRPDRQGCATATRSRSSSIACG